jgi:RNA polymerase sigma factor (sigma-70 family)
MCYVQLVKNRFVNSFEEIYDEHETRVFNIALHYVRNISDAEEITQDVFLKVYERLHKFKEQSTFSTWIHRITVNSSIDHLRKQQAQKRSFIVSMNDALLPAKSDFIHPGIQLEEKESLRATMKIVNELPNQQKTAVILHKIEGLSQQKTAEIMKKSEKSIESLIGRARKTIKDKLENSEGLKHL